jgi:hypothetical protein
MLRNRIDSSIQADQDQQNASSERQNQSESPQERLQRTRDANTRLLRSVADNIPSTSNADRPIQAPELDQPRDQGHPQLERRREAWRDKWHRYMMRPYHLLTRCQLLPMPYEYDMDGNLRWGWYFDVNSHPREVMSGHVSIREENSPELWRVEQNLGIRAKKEEWLDFSVDLLDRCDEMLEKYYLYIADIVAYSDTKQITQEERKGDEYKAMKNLVRAGWKKWNTAALLDINLSEVRPELWTEFSHNLLGKHADKYGTDSDNFRYLEDILRGQTADLVANKDDQVSPEERWSKKYKNLKKLVRHKWEEWNGQNKHDWYKWNKEVRALKDRDLLNAQLKRWNKFFDVLDNDKLVKEYSNDDESLRYLEDIKQCQISVLQHDYVPPKERSSPEYENLKNLARHKWEEWTRKKAGDLLGRDLSEVGPERWAKFSENVLSQCKDENKQMLLQDILQGGVTYIKDEVRNFEAYHIAVFEVRSKWDEQVKQQNNSREIIDPN